MKHTILSIILCGYAVGAAAQGMTLDECIDAATEHNRTLLDRSLALDAASQRRSEAFTGYFPQISASGGAFQASGGLMQSEFTVPQMGTLPISMMKKGVFAGITAVQPVFAGLQIVTGNKLARLNEEVERLRLYQTRSEVAEQTETYYWQIVSLRENLSTIDAVERQLDEIHRQVALSVEAGLVTTNDLLRVELQQQQIASNRLKAENALKIMKLLMAKYIGVEYEGFDISVSDSFAFPEQPSAYYISTEEAVDLRYEMQLAGKGVEAAQYRVRMERGKLLPSVGVGAGYLYNDLTGKDVAEGIVFAQVSVPISDWWSGSHSLRRARIEERQAENERDNARDMLSVEIEKTWLELVEAYCQIELMQRSVASSTENLRQQRDFYQAGTGPLTDLLDAETIYTESCNNLTAACAAYRTSLARYMRVTGR